MLNKDSDVYYASGSWGDFLMIYNKFKSSGLDKTSKLIFYTNIAKCVELVQGFIDRNNIDCEVVLNPQYVDFIKSIKDKNITITTIWDGDVEKNEGQKIECNSDGLILNPFFNVIGDPIRDKIESDFFILQTDAGLQYHNDRKRWLNVDVAISLAKIICKIYHLKCVIVGSDLEVENENFININNKNYEIISYIQQAKFVIGLTSFVTLLSLMSRVPTIYKKETDLVEISYYGHPEWQSLKLSIDEIESQSLNEIKKFIDNIIKT